MNQVTATELLLHYLGKTEEAIEIMKKCSDQLCLADEVYDNDWKGKAASAGFEVTKEIETSLRSATESMQEVCELLRDLKNRYMIGGIN